MHGQLLQQTLLYLYRRVYSSTFINDITKRPVGPSAKLGITHVPSITVHGGLCDFDAIPFHSANRSNVAAPSKVHERA